MCFSLFHNLRLLFQLSSIARIQVVIVPQAPGEILPLGWGLVMRCGRNFQFQDILIRMQTVFSRNGRNNRNDDNHPCVFFMFVIAIEASQSDLDILA